MNSKYETSVALKPSSRVSMHGVGFNHWQFRDECAAGSALHVLGDCKRHTTFSLRGYQKPLSIITDRLHR